MYLNGRQRVGSLNVCIWKLNLFLFYVCADASLEREPPPCNQAFDNRYYRFIKSFREASCGIYTTVSVVGLTRTL